MDIPGYPRISQDIPGYPRIYYGILTFQDNIGYSRISLISILTSWDILDVNFGTVLHALEIHDIREYTRISPFLDVLEYHMISWIYHDISEYPGMY